MILLVEYNNGADIRFQQTGAEYDQHEADMERRLLWNSQGEMPEYLGSE